MSTNSKPPEIKNFSALLKPSLDGGKLVSYKSEYFMGPGDNYGSTIFKITAQIKSSTANELTTLELIGKLLPLSELFIVVFHPERTFRTEMDCYTKLAPAFIKLQKEAHIADDECANMFAKCYGARISLKENAEKVDSGAALILENLTVSGYKMGERIEGFDYEMAIMVLRDLARYHAMGIGLRLKYPEEFDKNIRPFLKIFAFESNAPPEMITNMMEENLNAIKRLPNIDEGILEKVMMACNMHEERVKQLKPCPDSLFSTVIHQDFWTNNILISYDNNEKPKDIKIVDFQMAEYNSLAHDVIFFLLSSIRIDIIEEKFDQLLHEYYEQFIGWLSKLGCSIESYSYDLFDEEMRTIAPYQFNHIVTMRKLISFKKDNLPDTKDMDGDFFKNKDLIDDSYYRILSIITNLYKNRYFPYMK